jgi:hypothetical protein
LQQQATVTVLAAAGCVTNWQSVKLQQQQQSATKVSFFLSFSNCCYIKQRQQDLYQTYLLHAPGDPSAAAEAVLDDCARSHVFAAAAAIPHGLSWAESKVSSGILDLLCLAHIQECECGRAFLQGFKLCLFSAAAACGALAAFDIPRLVASSGDIKKRPCQCLAAAAAAAAAAVVLDFASAGAQLRRQWWCPSKDNSLVATARMPFLLFFFFFFFFFSPFGI